MKRLSEHLTNEEIINDIKLRFTTGKDLLEACRDWTRTATTWGECFSVTDVRDLYTGTYGTKKEAEQPRNGNPLNGYIVDKSALRYEPYSDRELQSLAEDIKDNGQQVPVTLWFDTDLKKKVIIDGNHRQKACNLIGATLRTSTLPGKVKRSQLDKMLLSTQLKRRGVSPIHCNCEAFLYLHHKLEDRVTAKKLEDRFEHVDKKKLSYLKTIYLVRPLWFKALRAGKKVTIEGLDTDNVRRLYDICKNEEKSMHDDDEKKDDVDNKKGFTNETLSILRPAAMASYNQHKSRSAIAAACDILKAEYGE